MDRAGADFFNAVADINTKLNANALPIQIPIGRESGFSGIIDLITMNEVTFSGNDGEIVETAPIRSDFQALAGQWREKLIDTLSTCDEKITDLYLNGAAIPEALIRESLHKAVLKREILPVLCGASRRNMGVQPLLDAIIDYLPSPKEAVPAIGHHTKKGTDVEIACDPGAFPLGLVFKIQNDREAGSLCYVRMYSGKLVSGGAFYNTGKKKRERVSRILRMHSNKSEPMESLCAGDIGVAVGLRLAQTGDTLGSEAFPILLEKMEFPEPVISVSIESDTISERDKLKDVLELLSKEDPTFTTKENEETGQLLISGMGELHLDVLVTRILKDYNVKARVGNPQVTYRESISKSASGSAEFSRVIAGKENFATVSLTLECLPRGSGNKYNCAVKKSSINGAGAIKPEIFEAIERGVTGALQSGIALGYPCIDVGVTINEIGYSENTGTVPAFESAASMAFEEAAKIAQPILLEPVMAVDLVSPTESVGEVMSLVSQRGGQVQSMTQNVGGDEIKALAPMAAMFGFMTALRSVSQGRATFTLAFSHFEKKGK
jgi:elongation factor G